MWNNFREYISEKRTKLQDQYTNIPAQFNGDQQPKGAVKELFKGVVAFVSNSIFCTLTRNGEQTSVDHREISRLLLQHGGILAHKLEANVTHFIASQIPIYMKRDLAKHTMKLQLLSPMWIVDSAAANRKLNPAPYMLAGAHAIGQEHTPGLNSLGTPAAPLKRIEDMIPKFSTKDKWKSKKRKSKSSSRSAAATEAETTAAPSPLNRPVAPAPSAVPEQTGYNFHMSVIAAPPVPEPAIQTSALDGSFVSPRSLEAPGFDDEDDDLFEHGQVFNPRQLPETAESRHQNEPGKLLPSAELKQTNYRTPAPGRLLTSKENPNFVQDYFSSSRLHHLSRWRIQFQQQLTEYVLAEQSKGAGAAVTPSGADELSPNRIIAHIDMDAFFVSVSTRNRPELKDKPVVVSHGGNRGSCASVNYVARKMGVHNGTWLRSAMEKCGSALVVVPYDFDQYEEVSKKIYEIFLRYSKKVQAISCDEAILDLSDVATSYKDAIDVVNRIRADIEGSTNCTCSGGIGNSRILASLALKEAKPNGTAAAPQLLDPSSPSLSIMKRLLESCSSNPSSADFEFARRLKIDERMRQTTAVLGWISARKLEDLKGVGPAILEKLRDLKVDTFADLQDQPLSSLQAALGDKGGHRLWLAARGLDDKPLKLVQNRKSVSVELSYGVRFDNIEQVSRFIEDMAKEVHKRLRDVGLMFQKINLNAMRRHPDQAPTTFLGHGWVNTLTKSHTLPEPSNSYSLIFSLGVRLVRALNIPPQDIRGLGIHLSKLTPVSRSNKGTKTIDALVQHQSAKSTAKGKPAAMANNNAAQIPPEVIELLDDSLNSSLQNDAQPLSSPQEGRYLPFELEELDTLTPVISNWMRKVDEKVIGGAQAIHAELLGQFLLSMLHTRALDIIRDVLMIMRRVASSQTSWAEWVRKIEAIVQEKVTALYGAKLCL